MCKTIVEADFNGVPPAMPINLIYHGWLRKNCRILNGIVGGYLFGHYDQTFHTHAVHIKGLFLHPTNDP